MQRAEDRLAQHLDLALAAVASMDLDRPVSGAQGDRGVGDAVCVDVALKASEKRVGRFGAGKMTVVVNRHPRPEPLLHLAGVAGQRLSQRMPRDVDRRVCDPPDRLVGREVGDTLPQPVGRVRQPQVDIAHRREPLDDGQLVGGQTRGAEHRHTGRQLDDLGSVAHCRDGSVDPLGRALDPDRLAQPAPDLGLPRQVGLEHGPRAVGVVAGDPVADHAGSLCGVGGIESAELLRDGKPAAEGVFVVAVAGPADMAAES